MSRITETGDNLNVVAKEPAAGVRLSQEANGHEKPDDCYQYVVKQSTKEWHALHVKAKSELVDEIRNTGKVKIEPGKTLWDIAEANLKVHGKQNPSATETFNELARITEINKIKVPCGGGVPTYYDGNGTIILDTPRPASPAPLEHGLSSQGGGGQPKQKECFVIAPNVIDVHRSADGQRITNYYDNQTNVTTDHGKVTRAEYGYPNYPNHLTKSFGYNKNGDVTDFTFENGSTKEHWQTIGNGQFKEVEGKHKGEVRSMSFEVYGYGQVKIKENGSTFVYDSNDKYFYWLPNQQGRATTGRVKEGDELFKLQK